MKAGWAIKPLGEICEVFADGDWIESKDQSTEGIRLIQTGNVGEGVFKDRAEKARYISEETFNRLRCTEIIEGDCLISRLPDPVGRSAILPDTGERMITAVDCTIVRFDRKQCIPTFFNYYSQSIDYLNTIAKECTGTTRSRISRSNLALTPIPVPPLPEQHHIVAILDEAFDGIATAKANAEKNLQNARALFESHLKSVFSLHGDDWKMEKLDNLTDLARGHNPPKSKFSREQKPGYVRFYQIRDGATDDYTVYVPDTPQLHKMKKDDIMLVAYRHVGRAFRGVEGAFNVALCKISNARRDLLDNDFLFHLIPSQYVKGELLKRSERSLIPSMSIEHLREIKIPLPPIQEQKRLVETINKLTTETQRLESIYQQKLTALDNLKKSLLHQAFSGQL